MSLNKKHEDSVGKTFKSTLLNVNINKDALDSDYDFFMVYNEGEENYTPIISDPGDAEEFKDGRICGTFAYGRKRYVMLRKHPGNIQIFREYLDSKYDDFKSEVVYARSTDERIILNLLLNSSRHELNDYITYNNLGGKLYITYPKWKTKDHITTVNVTIERQTLGFVLSLSATMMSRIGSYKNEDDRAKQFKRPMYVITKEDGFVHRTFESSPNNYVVGNSGINNAEVPYSDPKNEDTLKLSKNYIFDLVIGDINCAFERYVRIEKESMMIEEHLDPERIDVESFMSELKSRIADTDFALINTDPDCDDSTKLEKIITDLLRTDFNKEVERSDEPVVGKFNLRIIHKEEFYGSKPKDKYKKFPGVVVQHLTIENCITGHKEDTISSIMNVLIKELFIKNCVINGEDQIGDWKDRGFTGDVIFLKREQIRKKPVSMYRIFRLTMHIDGKFDIDVMDDNDPILLDVIKNNWDKNNFTSNIEHAIIYNGNVCIIENSKIVPVIDNEVLLKGIRNKKPGRGHGHDGLGPRGYVTYNNALYAITDIQRLSYGDNLLYMCGYDGGNLIKKYSRAPNIRQVKCVKGENFFSELLELMNVPFVRHGQTTVYPYPYKFMTEFIEDYKRALNKTYRSD